MLSNHPLHKYIINDFFQSSRLSKCQARDTWADGINLTHPVINCPSLSNSKFQVGNSGYPGVINLATCNLPASALENVVAAGAKHRGRAQHQQSARATTVVRGQEHRESNPGGHGHEIENHPQPPCTCITQIWWHLSDVVSRACVWARGALFPGSPRTHTEYGSASAWTRRGCWCPDKASGRAEPETDQATRSPVPSSRHVTRAQRSGAARAWCCCRRASSVVSWRRVLDQPSADGENPRLVLLPAVASCVWMPLALLVREGMRRGLWTLLHSIGRTVRETGSMRAVACSSRRRRWLQRQRASERPTRLGV
jgi:hypothetical protein